MDQITKDKLAVNIANSWKMWSVRVTAGLTAIATAYVSLPISCPPELVGCLSQATVLNALQPVLAYVPAQLLTLATGAFWYFTRVKPQKGITPEVAAAKSMDAPQTTTEFPLQTGPAPLPPIEKD